MKDYKERPAAITIGSEPDKPTASAFAAARDITMIRSFLFAAFVISAIAGLFAVDIQQCKAQTNEAGQAVVCESIQKQINQLQEISKSTSLTDEEKMSQLAKSWADSLAAMKQFSENDNDNAKLVSELVTPVAAMLASALKTASSDGTVSPDTKQSLDKIGELIRPYVGIMKMICPNLALPESVPK